MKRCHKVSWMLSKHCIGKPNLSTPFLNEILICNNFERDGELENRNFQFKSKGDQGGMDHILGKSIGDQAALHLGNVLPKAAN